MGGDIESTGRGRGRFVAASVAFALLFTAVFSRIVLSGRILATGDGAFMILPAYHVPLSLWSPNVFAGYPVAADPESMFWYPLSLLLPNGLRWFSLLVALGYVIASFAQYVFVWMLTESRMAAAVAGLVYGLSGFFAAHIGHVNMIQAAAWAPLFLAGIERMRKGPGAGGQALAAFSLAMCILGGHPQIMVKVLILGGLYACVRSAGAAPGWKRFMARVLTASVLGAGMAAILLVPLWQLAGQSVRRAISYGFFVQGSLPPRQLITLVFPTLVGGWTTPFNHVAYFGKWYVSDVTGFVGLTAMLLAIVAVLRARPKRLAGFWAAVAIGSLVLALGRYTPLAHVLYHVPLINKFRSPSRYLFEFTIASSVLAGIGLAALQKLPSKERSRTLWIALAGVGIIIGLALAGTFFSAAAFRGWAVSRLHAAAPASLPWRVEAIVPPLVFFLVSFAALWIWSRHPASRLRVAVVVCAVAIELVHFGWIYPRDAFISASWFTTTRKRLAPLMSELDAMHARYAPFEGNHQNPETAVPNLSLLWGFPSVSGHNPLILREYAQFASMKRWGAMAPSVLPARNRALDLLSVRFLFVPTRRTDVLRSIARVDAPAPDGGAASRARSPEGTGRWAVRGRFGSTVTLENRRALPRVWAVREVVPLKKRQILEAVHTSHLPGGAVFDPRDTALVEARSGAKARHGLSRATVSILKLEPDHAIIRSVSNGPTFLVLSDVDYPGWQARVDGRPTPVLKTDFILRGVFVPAGRHEVRFDFRPLTFRVGLTLSLLSLLLFFGLAWRALRSGRREAGT